MDKVKLNASYSFAIEQEDKRLRLIVFDGDDELVCHKVNRPVLNHFIQAVTAHLFKGRLQLDKSGDDILVFVKNNQAGSIRAADLEQLINAQAPVVL